MFEVEFQQLALAPTMSAYRELEDLGLDLTDVKEVLEDGFDCPKSKRKAGVLERCLRIGNKILRVVAAKDYQIFSKKGKGLVF
ncbi:DUF4258 domain-containing protein [Candidatus Micrarchaeota archaeon]|nr:DUF4258 domain-containing protein [Candidatus Micrarchaeota archaeon]